MPLFRRRKDLDPSTAPFFRACAHVDAAQRALLEAVPTSRRTGIPLGEALSAFRTHLAAASDALEDWSSDPERRSVCAAALLAAREESETLRLSPEMLDFEALNGRLSDVLHPIEILADVEREMRRR